MKNKQQLKNAILLLLALSLIAVYIYSKKQTSGTKIIEQKTSTQNIPTDTTVAPEQIDNTISNPTPKTPSAGGIPAPKPNQ